MGYTFNQDDDVVAGAMAPKRAGMVNRSAQPSPGLERLRLAREQAGWQLGHGLFQVLAGTVASRDVYETARRQSEAELEADLAKVFLGIRGWERIRRNGMGCFLYHAEV